MYAPRTVSDSGPTSATEVREQPRPVVVPGGAQRRNRGLVLVGLVLVAGTAFGFWYLLQSVDQRQQYVVAARDIARWEQVSSSDFRLVNANIGDAAATAAHQMGAIYGQWATGPIPVGTFILPGMFRTPPLSSEAEARSIVIQISLPVEEVSHGALESGDTIALLGREPLPGPSQAFDPAAGLDAGFDAQQPGLSLIGVLRLDNVQGNNIVYIVEPARALQIQNLVNRYLAAADRQIWRLGIDLTAEDIQRALDNDANPVDTGGDERGQ